MNDKIQTIFWDFDGVLLNSNDVRDKGFLEVLIDYPKNEVDALMKFHQANGGLSRYVKFRYFFEEVRGEEITEAEIQKWADKFSEIILKLLIDKNLLIEETINFVKENYKNYNMHIVSGSDGKELKKICKAIEIDQYFNSIQGSPTPKKELVADLLKVQVCHPKDCVLIGDSINDFEAAKINKIKFLGYNDIKIECLSDFENLYSINQL